MKTAARCGTAACHSKNIHFFFQLFAASPPWKLNGPFRLLHRSFLKTALVLKVLLIVTGAKVLSDTASDRRVGLTPYAAPSVSFNQIRYT
jgi:hypothetical protein